MTAEKTYQEQIIKKAWEDAEFKRKLIADPKAAVKEAFGIDVPDTIEVEVVEESVNKYYLVLPQNPAEIEVKNNVEGAMWQ